VAIAIALANDPPILIADEPTTALDAATEVDVLALLAGWRRERGAALAVSSRRARPPMSSTSDPAR
jgi:ABC-type glutathione transport system ATPase component